MSLSNQSNFHSSFLFIYLFIFSSTDGIIWQHFCLMLDDMMISKNQLFKVMLWKNFTMMFKITLNVAKGAKSVVDNFNR